MADETHAEIETHPLQTQRGYSDRHARIPKVVALAAYEVYCEVWAPQTALITGDCRGGFGESELIAFLYARAFPKHEWRKRFEEAITGMEGLK